MTVNKWKLSKLFVFLYHSKSQQSFMLRSQNKSWKLDPQIGYHVNLVPKSQSMAFSYLENHKIAFKFN